MSQTLGPQIFLSFQFFPRELETLMCVYISFGCMLFFKSFRFFIKARIEHYKKNTTLIFQYPLGITSTYRVEKKMRNFCQSMVCGVCVIVQVDFADTIFAWNFEQKHSSRWVELTDRKLWHFMMCYETECFFEFRHFQYLQDSQGEIIDICTYKWVKHRTSNQMDASSSPVSAVDIFNQTHLKTWKMLIWNTWIDIQFKYRRGSTFRVCAVNPNLSHQIWEIKTWKLHQDLNPRYQSSRQFFKNHSTFLHEFPFHRLGMIAYLSDATRIQTLSF